MPERSDAVAAGLFDSDHWQSGIELFVIADMNLRSGGKADRSRQADSQACNPEPLKRYSMGRMVVHRAFRGTFDGSSGRPKTQQRCIGGASDDVTGVRSKLRFRGADDRVSNPAQARKLRFMLIDDMQEAL